MTILNFWIILTQKEYFRCKKEKNENHIEFYIFEIVYIPNFNFNKQFSFSGTTLPEKDISLQKEQN